MGCDVLTGGLVRFSVIGIGLLLIGTYRDNEIDENHPLPPMLDYLQENAGVEVVDIELGPLTQDSIRKIIGDTLHRDPDSDKVKNDPEMQTLVELVYAKTHGNAFFVMQLLKSLHRGGYITFDFGGKGGGLWRFNLTSIEAEDLPPTVVDLLVKQMLKLSDTTRTAMVLAACMGTDKVSLHSLAVAAGKKPEETAQDLWGALDAGLLLPTSGNYKIPLALGRQQDGDGTDNGGPICTPYVMDEQSYFPPRFSPSPSEQDDEVTYRFLHDRVQQAAYSLIPEGERRGVHRMIGTRLLEKVPDEDLEGMLYEIVNQLNHWLSPLERTERRTLMELNLRAGKKAIAATAFDAALSYFLVAKSLLDDYEKAEDEMTEGGMKLKKRFSINLELSQGPTAQARTTADMDELALEVNLSLMEGYFAQNRYEDSINLADKILPRCAKPREKIRCLVHKMNCLLVQGRLNESIETGLLGLSVLNWEVPLDDEEAKIHATMLKPRILMDIAQIKAIENLHPLKDENLILLQELISTLLLPVYMSRPALLPAVCFTSVAISLEFGISTAGAYPMLMTGIILSTEGTHEASLRGHAFGRLSIALVDREPGVCALAPAIYETYAGHIGIFHQSMSEVLRCLQQAVSTGIAMFNVDFTVFAL
jgi:osomolarity two-component system sensor histidine kinase CHK1